MSDNVFTNSFSDASLQQAADLAGISVQTLKGRINTIFSDPDNLRHLAFTTGESEKSGDCIKIPFDVSFYKILGLSGYVEFCGAGTSTWSATIHICTTLLGNEIRCQDIHLDSNHVEACFSVDVKLAKASICVGISGSKLCFYIKGEACYWAFGWHCEKFNETLFCIKK